MSKDAKIELEVGVATGSEAGSEDYAEPFSDLEVGSRKSVPSGEKVSFVCVTRNRRELASRCLSSCVSQMYDDIEVIVVDNASTDGTVKEVRRQHPDAILIEMHRNIGFFPALNIGIANASGEYVMTVDDDAYFMTNDCVAVMVDALQEDPQLAGVTCNIIGPRELPAAAKDEYVPSFKTGFAMLRRKVFTEWVGFYPDAFFRSGGEEFLSTALWDMNRGLKRLADVRMYHDQAAVGRSNWDWAFYGYRSAILVTLMRDPWCAIPFRLASKFLGGLVHVLRKRRGVDIVGWAAAWCNVWLYVPYAIRQRRGISWSTFRKLRRLRSCR